STPIRIVLVFRSSFSVSRRLILRLQVWRRRKNLAGESPPPDSDFLTPPSFEKSSPAWQVNSPQAQIADSSSRKAVNILSACTTKRFPSTRCASIIQIVRPSESTAETQHKLQPRFLRLSAIISK